MYVVFVMPFVLYIFIFSYLPMLGIVVAFKDFKYNLGIWGSKWVGFSNFRVFFGMVGAVRLFRNTLLYNAVFILSGTAVSLIVAFLLFEIKSKRAVKAYQTMMFIPYYLSWVVVTFIGFVFLSYNVGLINMIAAALGQRRVNYYVTPGPWPGILIFMNIWKSMAVGTALYYSQLLSIDPEYKEAALLEGANRWQIVWHIYLPFLFPILIIMHILAIGGLFNSDFGLFYQFTMNNGALYSVTDVLDTYIYRTLTSSSSANYSMSTAAGLLKSVIGMILIITTNGIVKKLDRSSSLF